jgi:hypothetical protein
MSFAQGLGMKTINTTWHWVQTVMNDSSGMLGANIVLEIVNNHMLSLSIGAVDINFPTNGQNTNDRFEDVKGCGVCCHTNPSYVTCY